MNELSAMNVDDRLSRLPLERPRPGFSARLMTRMRAPVDPRSWNTQRLVGISLGAIAAVSVLIINFERDTETFDVHFLNVTETATEPCRQNCPVIGETIKF